MDVFEWQVLHFRTTCSPCCVTYALQRITELWLSKDLTDLCEGTLGLVWHSSSDMLGYKHRPVEYQTLTLRNLYRILASQYGPLGFIIPFTTRAKFLLQKLWSKDHEWDDLCLPKTFVRVNLIGQVHISFVMTRSRVAPRRWCQKWDKEKKLCASNQ